MNRRIPLVPNLYYRRLAEVRKFGDKNYTKSKLMINAGAEKTTEKVADRLVEHHRQNGTPARKVKFSPKTGGGYAVFVNEGRGTSKTQDLKAQRKWKSERKKLKRTLFFQGTGSKNVPAFRKLSSRNLKREALTPEQKREVFAKGKLFSKGMLREGVDLSGTPQGRHFDSKTWMNFGEESIDRMKDGFVYDPSQTMLGWRTGELPDNVMAIRTAYPGAIEHGIAKIGDVKKVIAKKQVMGRDRPDFKDYKSDSEYESIIRIGNSLYDRNKLNEALKIFGSQEIVTFNTLQADDTETAEWKLRNRHHANWRNKPDSAVSSTPNVENTHGDVNLPLIIAGEEFSVFVAPFTPQVSSNPLYSSDPNTASLLANNENGYPQWYEEPAIERIEAQGHPASLYVQKRIRGGTDEQLNVDKLLNTSSGYGVGTSDLARRYVLTKDKKYKKKTLPTGSTEANKAPNNPNNIYYIDLNYPTLYFNTLSNQIRVTGDKSTKKPKITATTVPSNKENKKLNKKNRPPPLFSQIIREGTNKEEFKISAWINPPVNRGVILGIDTESMPGEPRPVYLPVSEMDYNPQYQPKGGSANFKYGGGYPV